MNSFFTNSIIIITSLATSSNAAAQGAVGKTNRPHINADGSPCWSLKLDHGWMIYPQHHIQQIEEAFNSPQEAIILAPENTHKIEFHHHKSPPECWQVSLANNYRREIARTPSISAIGAAASAALPPQQPLRSSIPVSNPDGSPCWSFKTNQGFQAYDQQTNAMIELAFKRGLPHIIIPADNYKIVFTPPQFKQIDLGNGQETGVARMSMPIDNNRGQHKAGQVFFGGNVYVNPCILDQQLQLGGAGINAIGVVKSAEEDRPKPSAPQYSPQAVQQLAYHPEGVHVQPQMGGMVQLPPNPQQMGGVAHLQLNPNVASQSHPPIIIDGTVCWSCMSDSGWIPYSGMEQQIIEQAFIDGKSEIILPSNRYKITFNRNTMPPKFTQFNIQSKYSRQVARTGGVDPKIAGLAPIGGIDPKICWSCMTDQGWKPYNPQEIQIIEQAFISGLSEVRLKPDYKIIFDRRTTPAKCTQINTQTRRPRQVERTETGTIPTNQYVTGPQPQNSPQGVQSQMGLIANSYSQQQNAPQQAQFHPQNQYNVQNQHFQQPQAPNLLQWAK